MVSLGGPAAIDDNAGPGHHLACVGGEEKCCSHEILDGAYTAKLDVRQDARPELWILEIRSGERRLDEGRGDRVGPDSVRRKIQRKSLAHPLKRPFRSAI